MRKDHWADVGTRFFFLNTEWRRRPPETRVVAEGSRQNQDVERQNRGITRQKKVVFCLSLRHYVAIERQNLINPCLIKK